MSDELLRATGLRKSFPTGSGSIEVLRGIDLALGRHERLAIEGQSGVGKSTLLHILGTLDRPSSGRVTFRGEDLFARTPSELSRFRNDCLGFIFQFHHLLPEFNALENVMMPATIRRIPRAEAAERASRALADVGLADRMDHKPGELSGGEQQRVALARALVLDPPLLLADEVTGNLDARTGAEIHDLLFELNRTRGVTLIVVTHNNELADRMPRRLVLEDGLVKERAA